MGRKARGLTVRKPGPLPDQAKLAIALICELNPDASARAIAGVLGRREQSIHAYIAQAQQILQVHAPWYAAKHLEATAVAAAQGNAGPAQWALERLCATDDEGKEVRIVEKDAQVQSAQGLTVNIGLAVGNIPGAIPARSSIASLPIEVKATAVSDSSDEA